MRVVVLLALAGCYAANPATGVPCNPNQPACPTGQMCVAQSGGFVCDTMPGGPMPDAPVTANDLDGDGIPNLLDNCPTVANPDQANEDHDGFGDACDDCPPFPSFGIDSDGDGVGDPCDPHPQTPGDRIALWEPFNHGLPAGWTANGTWTVQGGNLAVMVNASDVSTLVIPYTATPHQTIYTAATITSLSGTNGGGVGVVDGFDATGSVGMHCGGARSGTSPYLAFVDASNGSLLAMTPHPFSPGVMYSLALTRTDDSYSCADGPLPGVTAHGVAGLGPFIGFRNRIASATYPWILVIASP